MGWREQIVIDPAISSGKPTFRSANILAMPLVESLLNGARIEEIKQQNPQLNQPEIEAIIKWPKRPLLIATEYPRIAEKWAYSKNLSHTILMTYGSTEAFAGGIADIIVDCVDTGQTLKANGIQIVDTIMHSSPGVYCRKECSDKWSNLINSLL